MHDGHYAIYPSLASAPSPSTRSIMARRCSAAAAAALFVTLCMVAASAAQQVVPSNMAVIGENTPGVLRGARNSKFTCTDTRRKRRGCMATCTDRCPKKCLVLCPTCKTFCLCDFYPGVSCGDPRFTGGDGNNFYFHGKKDGDFCIVSDANLHINAHFIGNHNAATSRDFTWIQAIAVLFFDDRHQYHHHTLHLGAVKTARWDPAVDHLNLTFDGDRVDVTTLDGARWSPASAPALSVTRVAAANAVVVELRGAFRVVVGAVPITPEESRAHGYGADDDAGDSDRLVHLDLGFKFHALTDDVHGVLGQTYRPDYVNRLNVTATMPVMGGADRFVSSGLFAADCAVARFGRRDDHDGNAMGTAGSTTGIAMVTDAN